MTPLHRVKSLLAGAVCLLLAVLGGNCLGVGLCGLFVLPWAPVVNGRAALPLVLTGLALTAAMALPAQAFRPRYRLPLFAAGVGLGLLYPHIFSCDDHPIRLAVLERGATALG